jgi:hypothetical protein
MGVLGKIKRRVVEALGGALLGDMGAGNDDGRRDWRPLSARGASGILRDLTTLSHQEMVKIALYLYGTKALAKWLVNMPVSLCVGNELSYSVTVDADGTGGDPEKARAMQEEIRKALDPFWYHPAHCIAEKAPEYARTFLVTGHLAHPITFINPTLGTPQLDLIDAAQISDVLPYRNPETGLASSIIPNVVQYETGDGSATTEKRGLLIVRANTDGLILPLSPENVPAKLDDVVIKGQCLYFRANELLNSMRGTSYLTDVADWIDALDQFAWVSLDRARLRNSIVWILKLTGKNDVQIAAEVDKLSEQIAQPNSIYGGNEQTELEAKSPDLGAAETTELGRMILTYVLGAKGFPESWYSQGGNANRATAGEQTDVAYKALAALQTRFHWIFRTMLHLAYDLAAERQTNLPKRNESPWLSIEPELPTIQERDMAGLAKAVGDMATGLEGAVAGELISKATAQELFLTLVVNKGLGGGYSLDEEQGKIENEAADRAKKQADEANAMARNAIDLALAGGKKPPKPNMGPNAMPKPVPKEGAAA